MSTKDLIEERVNEIPNPTPENKATLRRILGHLFDKAEKGNWAANKLEDEWGFTGDYAGGQDWGNEITKE